MSSDAPIPFAEALAHYQSGRLREAEQLCWEVVRRDPQCDGAWNLLGIVAYASAQYEPSLELFGKAVALRPEEADFHSNLGLVHQAVGRLERARECYLQAIHLNPLGVSAHINLGSCLHDMRRYDEAVASHLRALALDPKAAVAHNNLGNSYLALGKVSEAIVRFCHALELSPNCAATHNNLGTALLRQDRLADAALHFQRALELHPRLFEAYSNLGEVCKQQGDWARAAGLFRRAIELRPGCRQALTSLGSSLLMLEDRQAAIECFRQALQAEPHSAENHDRLGNALRHCDRLDEAVHHFERALALDPRLASAHANLGATWHARGVIDAAITYYRQALALDSRHCFAHTALAQALVAIGQGEAALAHIQQAIDVEPRNALAHWLRASTSQGPLDESSVRHLGQLLAEQHRTDNDRCLLHFALAHSCDKAGDYSRALEYAHRANGLKTILIRRRGRPFDQAAHQRHIDELIAFYTPEFFAAARALGTESELPIFVVGMPRSGTTLVEQILASHSQVFGAGELDDMHNLHPSLRELFASGMGRSTRWTNVEIARVRACGHEHLQKLARLGNTAARVVDKMPTNFLHLGMIAALFPQAQVIHCVRDPRDVLLSCYFQNFSSEEMNFTFDWNDLAAYLAQYQRLMAHWRKVLPLTIRDVTYEQLVRHQERVSRMLVGGCGLAWESRCLEFHKTSRTVSTASAAQVREPIHTESVARWLKYEPHLDSFTHAFPTAQ